MARTAHRDVLQRSRATRDSSSMGNSGKLLYLLARHYSTHLMRDHHTNSSTMSGSRDTHTPLSLGATMRPVVELSAIATPHSFMHILLQFSRAGRRCCLHHAIVAVVIGKSVRNLLRDYGYALEEVQAAASGGRLEVCRPLRWLEGQIRWESN
jgi:hypothetical protein